MSKAKNILRTRYAQDNRIKIDILTEYIELKDLAKEKVLKKFLENQRNRSKSSNNKLQSDLSSYISKDDTASEQTTELVPFGTRNIETRE